jgi:hypothetical protein
MRNALLTAIILTLSLCAQAQDESSFVDKAVDFPSRLFKKINNKASDLDAQLTRQTQKYLDRLSKQEAKLRKKLYKLDSARTAALYASNPEQQYKALSQKLSSDSARTVRSMGPEYLPYADSLQSSLAFVAKNPQLNTQAVSSPQAAAALSQLQQLEAKLQDADGIKQFIQQRRDMITQYLNADPTLQPYAAGMLSGYNKEIYYYSALVRQYREMLNNPDKMLKEALVLLNRLPAFTTFMKNNSFLAGLFSVASNYGSADGMVGLQSRDQILAMIQNQVGSGGPNAGAMLQTSLQTAQQDITNLQNKLSNMGGGSGDIDMPNFKPQQTKTKTFLQRLEYGTNMQTTHAAYYFPTTTDLGVSVGYKLSDKSTVGIGASYKVGWGSDFQHISMSAQGAGLRSYLDLQAKKSFYLSGGFEYNYLPLISTLGYLSSWQQSGLIGVSKVVSMNTKVFKKTKVQLLWDFLSYQQVPRAQPFLFRVGYTF